MGEHWFTKGGEYMTDPPLKSVRFGAMNMDAPIWDAETTKRLLQALEAKMDEKIRRLEERLDKWEAEAQAAAEKIREAVIQHFPGLELLDPCEACGRPCSDPPNGEDAHGNPYCDDCVSQALAAGEAARS